MSFQLPKPNSWIIFESLCHELWRSFWGDINAQKYGRQGYPQSGVDIYGHPAYSRSLHAVQCKGKDDYYDSKLTKKEIKDECDKAVTFPFRVKDYTIATTSPRDPKLQQFCMSLNAKQSYPFPVNVWSWDDIEPEILARENILRTYYDTFKDIIPPGNECAIEINSSLDKVAAFLTRPNIQQTVSRDLLQLIHPLLYELVDNAFLHGHAGYCKIVINDSVFQIIDNGQEFDTSNLALIEGRQGVAALRFVMAELKADFHLDYKREDGLNLTSLVFTKSIINKPLNVTLEITIPDSVGMGRFAAGRQAVHDFRTIPEYKKRIVINVLDNMFLGGSFASGYLIQICKLLNEDQTVVAYVPANATYLEAIKNELEDYPIEFIERK